MQGDKREGVPDSGQPESTSCQVPRGMAGRSECDAGLSYLPSYSPELNPDEYLNRDLKAGLAEQNLPASKEALKHSVETHMRKRQNAPESIKKLFEKDEVRYASEDY